MISGKYNQAKTVTFGLPDRGGDELVTNAVFVSGDVVIMKDEGAEANTTNLPTDEGTGYSLVLTATEMSAARIQVYLIDQASPNSRAWRDKSIGLETYGNSSAEHAFDLDAASVSLTATGLDAIASTATGMVEIAKAVWDRVLTAATHDITDSAGKRVRAAQTFQGYENGAVWIDTVNGTSGTTDYTNGTVENPVDNLADANTLLASVGLSKLQLIPGSSITLAAAQNNQAFSGESWTLALGGQNIGGSTFVGASVSGIATGSSVSFKTCDINTCTLDTFHAEGCSFNGTVTFGTPGSYVVSHCHSGIAGSSTPIFDVGAALLNVSLALPGWNNGVEIQNLNSAGTDLFSISGHGQIVYAASSSGTVEQRGNWKVTNTGGVTINTDDNSTNITSIDARLPTALIGGRIDADIEAINNDTTAADNLSKSALGIVTTTVNDASASTTGFITALTETTDDHYKGRVIVFTSGVMAGQATDITAYTGSTKRLTVTAMTEAPADSVAFVIV